jgi:DNA-binding transcriptional MocR family regulator
MWTKEGYVKAEKYLVKVLAWIALKMIVSQHSPLVSQVAMEARVSSGAWEARVSFERQLSEHAPKLSQKMAACSMMVTA